MFETLQIVQPFRKKFSYYGICLLLAVNLFRPLFLMSARPHGVSRLIFLFYSLDLPDKVTYIFWTLTSNVVLSSYQALVSSFCTLSQDFATHFLHVTSHDGTLVFHYVVGDVYLHYGLSPIN